MSLLMEALKKAEQAKKNAAAELTPPLPSSGDSAGTGPPEATANDPSIAHETVPAWEIDSSVGAGTAPEQPDNATTETDFPAIEWELPTSSASTAASPEETPLTADTRPALPAAAKTAPTAPLALNTSTATTVPLASTPISTADPSPRGSTAEETPPITGAISPPQKQRTLTKKQTALQRLARTMFDAKRNTISPIHYLLIGIAIIGVAAAAGGIVYFWQAWGQLHAVQPPLAFTPSRPVQISAPLSRHLPVKEAPAIAATRPAAGPTAKNAVAIRPAPQTFHVPRQANTQPHMIDNEVQTPPTAPIDIHRSRLAPHLDARLLNAYHAFMSKNVSLAQREYTAVLKHDPNNRDALLGMAAIAIRQHHPQLAARHYLQLLTLNPQDATARAGLATLGGQTDPLINERRLQSLLVQHPRSPYLYFALGSLYAAQLRWSKAQQAFFNALRHDAKNPDILYNLAVSLDHLSQPRLALSYYRQALDNAHNYPANFDQTQLQHRIAKLTHFTAVTRNTVTTHTP